jgi:hypothetical protein
MNPHWGPGQESSDETIKELVRIREALEWITDDVTHPENSDTWSALREIEPERTRIELFDCVWWIYFRQIEPVPATVSTSVSQR